MLYIEARVIKSKALQRFAKFVKISPAYRSSLRCDCASVSILSSLHSVNSIRTKFLVKQKHFFETF